MLNETIENVYFDDLKELADKIFKHWGYSYRSIGFTYINERENILSKSFWKNSDKIKDFYSNLRSNSIKMSMYKPIKNGNKYIYYSFDLSIGIYEEILRFTLSELIEDLNTEKIVENCRFLNHLLQEKYNINYIQSDVLYASKRIDSFLLGFNWENLDETDSVIIENIDRISCFKQREMPYLFYYNYNAKTEPKEIIFEDLLGKEFKDYKKNAEWCNVYEKLKEQKIVME